MQEPKLLSQESNIHGVDTGDVATRLIEARHETSLNRVGAARVHNRNGRGRGFGHDTCRRRADDAKQRAAQASESFFKSAYEKVAEHWMVLAQLDSLLSVLRDEK